MASRTSIFLILSILACLAVPVMADEAADGPANNGIWLQAASSGHQAWAYYPYDPSRPLSGGAYSAVNTGTSYFTVTPGTSIYRKYIVLNNEPYNDSVSYEVSGIPSDWGLTYTTNNPLVISYVYNPSVGQGAQNSHQGFGFMVVSVPESAATGTYKYTIKATSGTGYASSLSDSIVVGEPRATATPTPMPTATPTPTPTVTPTPTPDPSTPAGTVSPEAPTPTPTPSQSASSTPTVSSSKATSSVQANPSGIYIYTPAPTLVPMNTTAVNTLAPANPSKVPSASPVAWPQAATQNNDIIFWLGGLLAAILLVSLGYLYVIRK